MKKPKRIKMKTLMKHKWGEVRASDSGEDAEVLIYGDIGFDWWADESVTAIKLVREINELVNAERITARINSYGGLVSDGTAIFNALRNHAAHVTTIIDGVAYSVASMIAMAGDEIHMPSNTTIMIHAPWNYVAGNSNELRLAADVLDKTAEGMASSYVRGELTYDEALGLLQDGVDHYYTAAEALEAGLIDVVDGSLDIAASRKHDLSRFKNLPAAAAAFTQVQEIENMADPKKPAAKKPANEGDDDNKVVEIQKAAEANAMKSVVKRNEALGKVFAGFDKNTEVMKVYHDALADPSVTVEVAQSQAMALLGKDSGPLGNGDPGIDGGEDESEKIQKAASEAILARTGRGEHDYQNPFRGMRLHEIAKASLVRAGANIKGMTPEEFAPLALSISPARGAQTTSDFPVILENALHKMVLDGYSTQSSVYERFCKIGDVTDFRPWARLTPGLMGNLDGVNEAGEYKNKNIPDAEKETVQATRKGNILQITPEIIINDDLGYVSDMAADSGRAGPRTIDKAVMTLLGSNPTMNDGVALFHATHGNLAASGAVPSVATLEAAGLAMALQTAPGEDGVELDISPELALVHRALYGTTIEVVKAEFNDDTSKNQRKPNRVRDIVNDIVPTVRLSSQVKWYLFAAPNEAPVIEVVFLNGQREPRVVQDNNFRTGGLAWRIELPFGVGAIGYRGAYQNPGA